MNRFTNFLIIMLLFIFSSTTVLYAQKKQANTKKDAKSTSKTPIVKKSGSLQSVDSKSNKEGGAMSNLNRDVNNLNTKKASGIKPKVMPDKMDKVALPNAQGENVPVAPNKVESSAPPPGGIRTPAGQKLPPVGIQPPVEGIRTPSDKKAPLESSKPPAEGTRTPANMKQPAGKSKTPPPEGIRTPVQGAKKKNK